MLRATWLKMLRNWRLLALFFVLSVVGSVYYVLTAEPQYTANGALLIDPREGEALESRAQSISAIGSLDALTVDSELRVLTSREVTTRTMLALDYGVRDDDEEAASPSLRARLEAALGMSDPLAEVTALPGSLQEDRQREALRRSFVKGLRAQRAGDSYVIDITYTSPDIAFSAASVNTLMQEYLSASGQRQRTDVERTRDWLSERIATLEVSVREAETAVAEFRGENELVALEGELLPTEIALNSAVSELIRLRGAALILDVEVQQLAEQVASGQIDAVQVPDGERTNALDEFETRYAELLREEQEQLLRWAEDAPMIVGLRQRKEQIRSLILDEYRQLVDRMTTRRDALTRQITATETVIDDLRSEYSGNIRQTVELRNLEREANAKRQLYTQLLEEFNSSSQLLTFEGTSARVIAWAVPPDKKSAPQSRQIVVLSVFGAMFLAISLALLREAFDGSFRAYDDISRDLGLKYLGLLPSFRSEARSGWLWSRFGGKRLAVPGKKWRRLSRAGQRLGFASKWPASVSAETMRAIHVQLKLQQGKAAEAGGACQIVGFTSTTRSEGKTTAAFNFASFLSQQNKRVAIIDMDLASQNMSKLIGRVLPDSNHLAKLLMAEADAMTLLRPVEEFPNLAIIGNPVKGGTPVSTMRDQDRIEALLAQFRESFDIIVLDLPPMLGVADTPLMIKMCDKIIYMVRWGWTPRSQVKSVFRHHLLPKDKILGVLFSRANIRKYRWFNRNDMIDYYN